MAKKSTKSARKVKTTKVAKKKVAKKATKKAAKKIAKKGKTAIAQTTAAASSGTMIPASFSIGTGSEDDILRGAFKKIIARGNQHQKSPVCYSELSNGQWEICLLQSDGSYGGCQRYYGPVHTPVCDG